MLWSKDDRNWMRFATVGTEFSLTFLGALGLGYWLDGLHGPRPAYMLTCGALGFAIGLYRLVRQALDIRGQDSQGPAGPPHRDDTDADSAP